MIVCVQCGTKIMEQRTSCPSCGTFLPEMQSNPGTEAKAGAIAHGEQRAKTFLFDSLFEEYLPQPAPIYDRIYTPTMPRKAPAREQEKAPRVAPVAHSSDVPTRHTFRERFFPITTNRSLMVEIVLSLFLGIFGIGWLLIGKRRTGIFLLITSLIFYAPLLIVSYALAYSSYGLSILCTGPFITSAVALNAFILYKTMQYKRRARRNATT